MKKIYKNINLFILILLLLISFTGCTDISSNEHQVPKQENINILQIPEYSGTPYCIINNNIPYFTEEEIVDTPFEEYSNMDILERCGICTACLGIETMPTKERGSIGMIKPSGWHTVKYDFVDGKYLYNRCHLIGFQLSGENANAKNLITGTRYMNTEGMLPFENDVADYIRDTQNHVMYRVTPVFKENNLVASGVLIEALSVEDEGEGICFNVYCYNVQPDVEIDYRTGESYLFEEKTTINDSFENTYILNTNSKKFHKETCSNVSEMKENNKEIYTGSRETLLDKEYEPCKNCTP